jgi:multidrug resistance efflux pump
MRAALEKSIRGARAVDKEAAASDASSAKARADQSAVQLQRIEKLSGTGAATPEELDRARLTAAAEAASARAAEARARGVDEGFRSEDIATARAQVEAAEGKLEQARAALERRYVRAPFAGEILQVKSRIGEYYTPGTSEPLMVLGDTSKLRVRMDVDERDIGRVRTGAKGFATADSFPGKHFAGKVVEIGRRMGRKNIRTDDPVERIDTKVLEVVLELEQASGLVPGLRVSSFIEGPDRG